MAKPRRRPARRSSNRGRRQPWVGSWLLLVAAGALFGSGVYLGLGWRGPASEPGAAEAESAAAPATTSAPEPRPPEADPALALATPERVEVALSGPAGHLALVMDDLGRNLEEVRRIENLGIPVSYAVLPHESHTAEVVTALARGGHEVLLHLPMQPGNGWNPGPGALHLGMSADELEVATRDSLARVPSAVGVNNHMGSELTRDPQAMSTVLGVLRAERLFFLDSRTSAESVAFRLARQMGLPAAERHVFLDPDPEPEAIRGEFRRLLEVSRQRGAAIAIGHPFEATLAILEQEVPAAVAAGFVFVPVSFLLERDSTPSR